MDKTLFVLLGIFLVVLVIGGAFVTMPVNESERTMDTSTVYVLGGFNSYGDFASQYAIDDVYAYYEGKKIEADSKTLEVLKGSLEEVHGYILYNYAKDSEKVYYQGRPLRGAIVDIFQPIENGPGSHTYGTDGQTVYFRSLAIEGADPKTFEVLWTTGWEGCSQSSYSKDAQYVYLNNLRFQVSEIVPGADPATFEALTHGFGKDKRGYYEGTKYIGTTIDARKLQCDAG